MRSVSGALSMTTRREALAGAALLLSGCATAPPRTANARLARLVARGEPDTVLGVGVIARDGRGRVRFAEAAGAAVTGEGASRRERPFTLDDPVRVASISKLAAMAGFMRLVEAGRAGLDDDVSDALGFRLRHPAHPDVKITPAMLASHTSGLRDSANYPLPLGRKLADAFTPRGSAWENGAWFAPADEPPGRFFTYGNVNFAVLAQVMERITGERFDLLMARTVFAPMSLDVGYNWSGVSQAKRDRASAACRLEAGVWTPQTDAVVPPAPGIRMYTPERPELGAADYRIGENGWAFSPQGGLRASVRDLDRLARVFAERGRAGGVRLLSEASIVRIQAPVWRYDAAARNGNTDLGLMRAYGLSVQALTGHAGPDGDAFFGAGSADWRGHLGEAYGLVSGLWWNVRDGRSLVYVINGTPADAAVTPGVRSALSPWEEAAIDAGLGG